MLLVDSLYINNSGGKVLLDILVAELESANLDVFYLFDERCKIDYSFIPDDKKLFLTASIFNRLKFYLKYKGKFSKVLCFANTPPPVKMPNVQVITYFHNTLLVDIPVSYSIRKKVKVQVLFQLMNVFKGNTNRWMVQSSFVRNKLAQKLQIRDNRVDVMPFYKLENIEISANRTKNSYCYVSTGAEHKNHRRLLEAWIVLLEKDLRPELHLTVPANFVEIIAKIDEANNKGCSVINHGLISKKEVQQLYAKTEFLVYPSLTESFGLPLIEAIGAGSKVIASDLPYVKDIVETQVLFDPYEPEDIADKICFSIENSVKPSHVKVENKISEIIKILS